MVDTNDMDRLYYFELKSAQMWIEDATRIITNLAGGGSENFVRRGETFRADLTFCERKIRDRFEKEHRWLVEAVKSKKALEVQLEAAQERIRQLEQQREGIRNAIIDRGE